MRATWFIAIALAIGCLAAGGGASAAEPKPVAVLKADGFAPLRAAYTPDGKTVVAVGEAKDGYAVRAFDGATGKVSASLDLPVEGVAPPPVIRPDGRAVAVVDGYRQTVFVHGLGAGGKRVTLDGPMAMAMGVAFSPDGGTVAVADDGPLKPRLRLFDAATGKERAGLDVRLWFDAPVFSPDGKALAVGRGVWELATGKRLVELRDRQADILGIGLAFSPDGKRVAAVVSGGDEPEARDAVRIWDTATGAETATIRVGLDRVRAVAFSPDGRGLAVVGPAQKADRAEFWDVTAGERRAEWGADGMAPRPSPSARTVRCWRSRAGIPWSYGRCRNGRGGSRHALSRVSVPPGPPNSGVHRTRAVLEQASRRAARAGDADVRRKGR